MKHLFGLLATTSLSLISAVAHADEAASDDSSIIVTAARAERTVEETGNSVTVIDTKDMERSQAVSVTDLLKTGPGVIVSRAGGVGSITAVNIRGADTDHTVALIDGVKLNDPSNTGGGFNFGNLLVGNIERIEVVRGSQSVLWGSQAIGGVVNMITRKPTQDLAVNARLEGGWRDTAQAVANVSGKVGPVSASLGGGYFRTDGFSAFNEDRGGTERDGYRSHGANASFNVALTDAVSVDLRGYYSHGRLDFDGSPAPIYTFQDTREYSRSKEFVGYAGLNAKLLDGRFANRLAYTRTETDRDYYDPDTLPVHNYNAQGTNERYEYQGAFAVNEAVALDFGLEREESRFDTVGGYSYLGDIYTYSYLGRARINSVYGQATVRPLEGLTLTAGVRHDDHNRFGGHTTFAANGAYTPNGGNTLLRASYGEGFKAPSLFQLYSDYGNPALLPEESKSWDAGVTQKLVDGRIEVAATWFHRDSTNLIVYGGGTYHNVNKARAKGLETSMAIRPVDDLTLQAAYTWTDSVDRSTGQDLVRRPHHTFAGSLDYRWPFGLETGVAVTMADDSADFDWDLYEPVTLDGYVVVDLRASYPLTQNIEIYGRIENLFDQAYETSNRYGSQPRSAFGGVRVKF